MDTELRALKIRALKQRLDKGEGHSDSLDNDAGWLDIAVSTLEKLSWDEIDRLWPISKRGAG